MLLARLLHRLVRLGRLAVIDSHGRRHEFGPDPEPSVTIRLHDPSLHWRLFFRPELCTGEAYMQGTLTVEEGTLYDFLDLIGRGMNAGGSNTIGRWMATCDRLFRRLQQFNPAPRSRRNVAHHYDLSSRLYDLFLDSDRQYSCAYFGGSDDDLEIAQARKKQHIAAKLLLRPGMRVLDIGSGWGGMAMYLADKADVQVTGITLSEEQLRGANERAADRNLDGRVAFHLRDYRQQTGVFDRIVSVGMFEHVGIGHFDAYFATLRDRLAEDGVALLHTIGRSDGPGATNPWIRKYIFPGGYIPALSEILPAIERNGLCVTDVEVLRLHYAETLRHWRQRFLSRRDEARALYDDRFCRMWEFYLAGSEISFRYMGCVVFQMQLARRQDAVPPTRSYIEEAERALDAGQDRERDTDRAA